MDNYDNLFKLSALINKKFGGPILNAAIIDRTIIITFQGKHLRINENFEEVELDEKCNPYYGSTCGTGL